MKYLADVQCACSILQCVIGLAFMLTEDYISGADVVAYRSMGAFIFGVGLLNLFAFWLV